MKLKKAIIITVLVIGLGIHSYACKCADDRTIAESFKGSTLVVHGRVISKELISFAETIRPNKVNEVKEKLKNDQQKPQMFESDFIFEIKLEVMEDFKGSSVRDTVTIYTTKNNGSCGYKFEMGKEYIVYALKKSFQYYLFLTEPDRKKDFERENTFWTDTCMRTADYYRPEADELRKLK